MSLLSYMLSSMLNIESEILSLIPDIRRTVAKVLRASRYYTDDHVEECMQEIMSQALDYAARTFDPNKGSAKSHFTCFAKSRAINWLANAHRRFEHVAVMTDTDDSASGFIPTEHDDPFALLVRKQEAMRIRAAFDALEPRQRALLEAFERTGSWCRAAKECGMSGPGASRMKAKIFAALKA
jgi:DNA-directed RNA polymerase specialized sigma24 family protein